MIEVAAKSGEGHLPSSFSVLEILWALYDGVMDLPDRFILSKGHASLALYAVLAEKLIIPRNWDDEFCQGRMTFLGHPERDPWWGIEATTGSLGHGAPMSVGLAYGFKLAGLKAQVYCLLGDQECNEGSVWEAALLAAHHKLDNLVWIVDDNKSAERSLSMGSLPAKFQAFGWHAEWVSGHSVPVLKDHLKRRYPWKPSVIVADTQKGYGLAEFEDSPNEWHHRSPPISRVVEMMDAVR